MARIRYGAIVQSINGSVGGHTFQTNAYGASLRTKPIPTKRVTTSQSSRRVIMSLIQAAWSGMSLDQKSIYDMFSSYKYSSSKHNTGSVLSGYNLFLKYNLLRYLFNGDILTTPAYTNIAFPAYASYVWRSGVTLYYTPNPPAANSDILVGLYLSPKTRVLNRFDKGSVRYITDIAFDLNHHNITTAFTAVFGTIPAIADYIQLKEVLISLSSPIVFTPSGHVTIIST